MHSDNIEIVSIHTLPSFHIRVVTEPYGIVSGLDKQFHLFGVVDRKTETPLLIVGDMNHNLIKGIHEMYIEHGGQGTDYYKIVFDYDIIFNGNKLSKYKFAKPFPQHINIKNIWDKLIEVGDAFQRVEFESEGFEFESDDGDIL